MATRFIRVRGRIVPIKDKKDSERSKGLGTTAALAAGSAVTAGIGRVAATLGSKVGNIRATRFGLGSYAVGAALGVGATGNSIYRSAKAGRKENSFGRGFIEYAKHYGVSTASALGGYTAVGGAIAWRVAKGAAKRKAGLK